MKLLDWVLGKYLRSSDDSEQRVGPFAGISVLGLDALTSSAYGPEAAMTVLLPLGAAGLHYTVPITSAIIFLLFLVFISYRQTIEAYPNGGGSYTVAKENLGRFPGLLAAAALLLDYVLTVAVGIAAGVGALISAVPSLQSHVLVLGLLVLGFITFINLRGVKDTSTALMLPTYSFIVSMLGVLGFGLIKAVTAGGHPLPVEPIAAAASTAMPTVEVLGAGGTAWLLMRAFASGCTAMTGVEAVSNGVKAFREPVVDNARRTLTAIVLILIVMLAAIAYLAAAYGVTVVDSNSTAYESVLSQLIRAIVGRGAVYYATITSVIAVLAISANTAFADFPRLCQIISNDDFMPHAFAERGRRLVFSYGVVGLAFFAAVLLILFGGLTDRLIPLYAIGAFLAFTLSQSGMVVHWYRRGFAKHPGKFIINAMGALATGITLIVVLISKFAEGGWISALVVAILMFFFYGVHRHYRSVNREIASHEPLNFDHFKEPIVVVPCRDWNKISRKALTFAMRLSDDVYGVHVASDDIRCRIWESKWAEYVAGPAHRAGVPAPQLVTLPSPYRKLYSSLFDFIDELETKHPNRQIAVVIPNLAERRWYHFFLHNQRGVLLNAALLLRRDPRIVIITVPWYLKL